MKKNLVLSLGLIVLISLSCNPVELFSTDEEVRAKAQADRAIHADALKAVGNLDSLSCEELPKETRAAYASSYQTQGRPAKVELARARILQQTIHARNCH